LNAHSVILTALSGAPDTQIDASATARLAALSQQATVRSDELLAIIDDCVYASLASDFAIHAMNMVWTKMLAEEGLSMEEALANRDLSLRTSNV